MATTSGKNQSAHSTVLKIDSSFDSFAAIRERLEDLREDPALRVIVLDLREPGFTAEDDPIALRHFTLPLVAAWAGELDEWRLSAGVFCDIRVGHTGQRLTWAPSIPGAGRDRLATVLGVRPEQIMTALAHGILQCGLVTSLANGDSLEEAERIAGVIASRGPIATQLGKEALWRGLGLPFEHALRFETDLTLLLQTTNDRAEGVQAFLEKRPPLFTGK